MSIQKRKKNGAVVTIVQETWEKCVGTAIGPTIDFLLMFSESGNLKWGPKRVGS